jgi:tripartite-type tricarboxylate transporter receptor subunit TctC
MAIALFRIKTGTRMEIIPYMGTGQAALAVAAGEADFAIMDASLWLPLMASRRVRALAVMGEKRIAVMPGAPTALEAGLSDYTRTTGAHMRGGASRPGIRCASSRLRDCHVSNCFK